MVHLLSVLATLPRLCILIVVLSVLLAGVRGGADLGDFTTVIQMITNQLSYMDGRASFLVQYKNGTTICKRHLASSGVTAYTDATILHVAGGSRWVAAATIMSLVEDGYVPLNTQIGWRYYWDSPAEVQPVTLLHMLSQTSGYLLSDDWIYDTASSIYNTAMGIFKGGVVYASTTEATTAPKSPQQFTPGTQVGYSDIGMQIAGAMSEQMTGVAFNTLFQSRTATRIGMTGAAFNAFDGVTGLNTAISDGLSISMVDYGKFLNMLMNAGLSGATQVLQTATVTNMLDNKTLGLPINKVVMKGIVPDDMNFINLAIGGSCIEKLDSAGKGVAYSISGVRGFHAYMDVSAGYSIVFFTRTTTNNQQKIDALFEAIKPAIASILIVNTTAAQLITTASALLAFISLF